MAKAALTVVLCLCFCVAGVLCFSESKRIQEKLKQMKEELSQVEAALSSQRAQVESERRNNLNIMKTNLAKVECLKKHSTMTPTELASVESYTRNIYDKLRSSYASMEDSLKDRELVMEQFRAKIKYEELRMQMQVHPLTEMY